MVEEIKLDPVTKGRYKQMENLSFTLHLKEVELEKWYVVDMGYKPKPGDYPTGDPVMLQRDVYRIYGEIKSLADVTDLHLAPSSVVRVLETGPLKRFNIAPLPVHVEKAERVLAVE